MSPSTTEAPDVTAVALDGAAIVQMLKPGSAKTFSEYAHSVFTPHIMATYRGDVSRVDLVWDQYIPNSLKQTRRSRRGRGVRRRVVSEGKLPGNWHSFLRVDEGEQAGVVRVLIRCPAALLHKLYLKKQDPEKIPPSKGALLQHLNRALLQGSCIWGQILSPRLMTLHSPTDWGWKFCNEQYEPLWSELPPMMEACMELTMCKCKKGCARSRCGCKKAELKCTLLCGCEGGCG